MDTAIGTAFDQGFFLMIHGVYHNVFRPRPSWLDSLELGSRVAGGLRHEAENPYGAVVSRGAIAGGR